VARDEDFWYPVQQAYTTNRAMINLNNGGVSPSPLKVQQALNRYYELANQAPAYTMWRLLEPGKELVRERLARLAGCTPEEIAITRNASESLETIIQGIELEPGDEVLTTNQDYPRMLTTWRQRQQREGIVLKELAFEAPLSSKEAFVQRFREEITPKTKVIMLCQVVFLNGQILPVRAICDLAHQHGIPVIVDGAHAFAHLAYDIPSLGCDYFGTSLHKWLCAPFGTGLLYVRKERIPSLWPLFADADPHRDDIRKFEEIGTHPCPIPLSIGEAVQFHEGIGSERKEARLRYLKNYWAERLHDLPRVRLQTSLAPEQSCAIATMEIEGIEPGDLANHLFSKHRIFVTSIDHPVHPDLSQAKYDRPYRGIRVTPHVYTTLRELDIFVDAVHAIVRDGI